MKTATAVIVGGCIPDFNFPPDVFLASPGHIGGVEKDNVTGGGGPLY